MAGKLSCRVTADRWLSEQEAGGGQREGCRTGSGVCGCIQYEPGAKGRASITAAQAERGQIQLKSKRMQPAKT